jgi:hypothetical protein
MMAADFWEIGASGRRYSREYVLAELQRRHSQEYVDQWQTSDFHCRVLADKVYLLTYTLQQRERVSRRATIWRRTETGWIILFHQGTLAQSS